MADEERFYLRVKYEKLGRLRFLSHLEVVRCMMRAIRRAGLPYAVSQGFSPHMKASFSAALPVGCCGLDEYIDVQLTRYVEPADALAALSAATAPSMPVVACAYVAKSDPVISAGFPVLSYWSVLDASALADDAEGACARVRAAVDALCAEGRLTYERKGKQVVALLDERLAGPIEVGVPDAADRRDAGTGPAHIGRADVRVSFASGSASAPALRADVLLGAIAAHAQASLPVRWLAHDGTFAKRVGEGRPL